MARSFQAKGTFWEEYLGNKKHGIVKGIPDARLFSELLKNFASQYGIEETFTVHVSKPGENADPCDLEWQVVWVEDDIG